LCGPSASSHIPGYAFLAPLLGTSVFARSNRFSEPLVTPIEEIWIRPRPIGPGDIHFLHVQALKAMQEHRSILFFENIPAHLNDVISSQTQQIFVKRRMMKLA